MAPAFPDGGMAGDQSDRPTGQVRVIVERKDLVVEKGRLRRAERSLRDARQQRVVEVDGHLRS